MQGHSCLKKHRYTSVSFREGGGGGAFPPSAQILKEILYTDVTRPFRCLWRVWSASLIIDWQKGYLTFHSSFDVDVTIYKYALMFDKAPCNFNSIPEPRVCKCWMRHQPDGSMTCIHLVTYLWLSKSNIIAATCTEYRTVFSCLFAYWVSAQSSIEAAFHNTFFKNMCISVLPSIL